jgi:hypothetical protein
LLIEELSRAMIRIRTFLCIALVFLFAANPSSTCEYSDLIWIPRSATADPLYKFVTRDSAGYIDQTGKVVIPPLTTLSGAGEFHDGLVQIGVADSIYVGTDGKKALDLGFYRGWEFSEGLAVAMKEDRGKWGYINTRGEFAITPRFDSSTNDYVWPFEGGFAKIEVAGRFGYIDHTGNFAVEPKFLDGDAFHDGMARVIVDGPCVYSRIASEAPCPDFGVVPKGSKIDQQRKLSGCKYTFIDTTGLVMSEQRFDYALPFAEGLAPVRIGALWGFIDKKGAVAIAPRFESAASFSDGLALVSENGLFGYIDRTGAYDIRPQFKSAENFVGGRAVVGNMDSGYRYIDHQGKNAIPGTFALASRFFKGLAHVKVRTHLRGDQDIHHGTFEYIDSTGKVVFTYTK